MLSSYVSPPSFRVYTSNGLCVAGSYSIVDTTPFPVRRITSGVPALTVSHKSLFGGIFHPWFSFTVSLVRLSFQGAGSRALVEGRLYSRSFTRWREASVPEVESLSFVASRRIPPNGGVFLFGKKTTLPAFFSAKKAGQRTRSLRCRERLEDYFYLRGLRLLFFRVSCSGLHRSS